MSGGILTSEAGGCPEPQSATGDQLAIDGGNSASTYGRGPIFSVPAPASSPLSGSLGSASTRLSAK